MPTAESNPFDNVMPESVNVISPTAVEIIIDLRKYPSLSSPSMIELGMSAFADKYPNLLRWRGFVSDDYLRILAEGHMNPNPTFTNVEQVKEENGK